MGHSVERVHLKKEAGKKIEFFDLKRLDRVGNENSESCVKKSTMP
jgi:hypothetical protein